MLIRVFIVTFILMLINSSNGLLQKHHQRVGTPVAEVTEGESQQKPRVIKRFAIMTNAQKNAKTAARLRELRREVEENRRFEGLHQAASIAGVRRRYEKYGVAVPYHQVAPHGTPSNATSNHTDAITVSSVTMSESLDTYFRPIDENVPRDHLVPFQEFGKKLHQRHRVKTTTINTNTLESTTRRSKEHGTNVRNSNLEDEIHEEMDVTFSKPYTEQNKVTRPHHIMLINPAGRRVMVSSNYTEETVEITTKKEEVTAVRTTIVPSVENIINTDEIADSDAASSNVTYTKIVTAFLPKSNNNNQTENADTGDLEKLPKAYLSLREGGAIVEEDGAILTTMKPQTNRTSTGFTLLHRTRGQINGAKKNMTANRKMLKEKADNLENSILNSTDRAKSLAKNISDDGELKKNITNDLNEAVVKPKRGNAMYTILNSSRRMPKVVDPEVEDFNKENSGIKVLDKVQESTTISTTPSTTVLTTASTTIKSTFTTTAATTTTTTSTTTKPTASPSTTPPSTTTSLPSTTTSSPSTTTASTTITTTTPRTTTTSTTTTTQRTTTKDSHHENPTSKILSTAVVTSISVLGDWTPLIPLRDIENTTSTIESRNTPTIVNITPRYIDQSRAQTKETVRVSYSKSIPGPQPPILRINTTNSLPNLNHSRRSSVIKMKNISTIMNVPVLHKITEPIRENTVLNVAYPNIFAKTEQIATSTEDVNIQRVRHVSNLFAENTRNANTNVSTEEPVVTSVSTEEPAPPQEVSATSETTMLLIDMIPDEVILNIRDGITTTEATTIHREPSPAVVYTTEPPTTVGIYAKNHRNYENTSEYVRKQAEIEEKQTKTDVVPSTEETVEGDTVESSTGESETPIVEEETPEVSSRRPVKNASSGGGTRKVNLTMRDRNRVVYRTDEDQVLRSKNRDDEEDGNDVAVYILGTFGIIPVAIAVLLTVRYCISRRKKIWESEKSPLTFVSTNEWEFPRSKLRLQTVLGQGNFGLVYKAEADDILGERATRLVAVKTIKDGATTREKEDLMRELVILKQIGAHSNVVTLLGCCTEKEPYLLILEYVMYGKLLSFLRDNRTRKQYYNFSEETAELTAKDLTSFAYCVARGMEYLTSKGIIHRDLAARNVLVDHNKICKVADFGMSRSVSEPGQIYEQAPAKGALPIRWMAPESLTYRVFTHKSDVWAFGILMWEIVTLGSTPYQSMCAREVIKQVRDGYRLERPNHCRAELYRVAATCWSHDPSQRPTFGEIKHELAELLEQGESQTYVDLESYIESISNSRTHHTTQVVNL